ncbi:MAG: outer membrane lipoprotein carrier protein LolA [Bacteroidales bacterium]|nr:outer membrane lipoprotein carrier protein LolA [Bacteroidales bacterium]
MKRTFIVTLIILGCIATSVAQTFNEQQAIQEISKAAATIKTLQCDFTQTKSLKMLGDKMVSKGKMYCAQPNQLRWEYTTPYTYTFILNNNNVLLKKGATSEVVDLNQNNMFKEIARIMMNSVLGTCLTDTKDFKVGVAVNGQQYKATLIPLKKEMKQMFTKIVLTYDTKTTLVKQVDLFECNGDNTTIELQNIKKNNPINATVFNIK